MSGRMTVAQALVRWLAAQRVEHQGVEAPLFGGVFAIFGHGNVAGLGEALAHAPPGLLTLRAHNEQAMGHAAVAYAKVHRRRRMLACTTSIGPGATNLVTAAATAHVNRLPVLLLPGDVFAGRRPDPVLQQLEVYGSPGLSANDCLRPVSRYWDRITRPEQLLASLPAALRVLLDPVECGPATVCLPQDVQAEAYLWPESFFAPTVHRVRRPAPDPRELAAAAELLAQARRPLIIAGGGVLYAGAEQALSAFAAAQRIPVAETQAGKSALLHTDPAAMGGIGVTGSGAANTLAAEADVILALGTRLSDFTSASRSLFAEGARLIGANVAPFDAHKHGAQPLVGDAALLLEGLGAALAGRTGSEDWWRRARSLAEAWSAAIDRHTAPSEDPRPTDAQVLGAVNRAARAEDLVLAAAGGLPGELHKLWRPLGQGSYHLEYGYSCMGYEIAGGLGARLARPEGEVFVLLGDGSWLMMSSELATAVAMRQKLVVVLLDNRGFGCIHRLQAATAGVEHNNLRSAEAHVDLAAHAAALGAHAERVEGIAALEAALARARARSASSVIVVPTDPQRSTAEGGAWWDVPVAEVSADPRVQAAHAAYRRAKQRQHPRGGQP